MTPATGRAAVYDGPGSLAVRLVDLPDPAPDEVLVRVSHCGVCGSDLHMVVEGWGTPGTVYGHEWSGEVVAIGSDVTRLSVGDRVVGGPNPCGRCRWCVTGRSTLCVTDPVRGGTDLHAGAYAEWKLAPAVSLRPVPVGMSLRIAALAEPLAVALHALTVGQVADGDRVLVTGAGPIGLLAVATLRARGVDDVTVCEPVAVRRERALTVGATRVVSPEELPAPPALPTDWHEDGYDVAIECSGRAAALEAALGLLLPGGRLVVTGTGDFRMTLNPIRVLVNELVVVGAYCYDDHGVEDALELLASGSLPVDHLLHPDDVPLEELLGAMQRLADGDIPAKVLVRP